ncbi:copper resistance protein CopD [Candidatus Nitrosopelagicus brevis]|uniref:Copper resistance protein CopD n=1 Tax=Candidatus Nitrosopelagicus brevis TaxID=1410606 RepID=A0A2R6TAH5_9ARCH|nr:CopD family protein [Candidatus Nitrosopelagicus brevis]PTL87659.1 copper resistance protein CopD [Candidatus Nitrosopelagicus brevis]
MKKIWILPVLVFFLGFPLASAHPFLLDSEPGQGQNAPAGTTQIITNYSEAVEIGFSELRVYDANGNQIDNKDTAYNGGETSLIVTTPPLEDGVYTITSKVLSKIDGHLVQAAIVFGVGDVKIDSSLLEKQENSETTFIPESIARFPGLVGQTIVLGGVIVSITIWSSQQTRFREVFADINEQFKIKFSKIIGIGVIATFASNFIMLGVQTWRLETSPLDVIGTTFGTTWLIRMIITIIIIGLWFWMEKKNEITIKGQIPLLIASLILIATTTMMGHGASTKLEAPWILDYSHNLLSSIWIGGVIFFAFVALPTITKTENSIKEKITLSLIPRFSGLFIIAIGILIITGPTLLWFLDDNVASLTDSTYGKLILIKIAIAAAMIGFGGMYQIKFLKNMSDLEKLNISRKISKPLKFEAGLGIALLAVVALLVNSSLPAGEIQSADAIQGTFGYESVLFSENAKFDVKVLPAGIGSNTISVIVTSYDDKPLVDISGLKIKVSNPQKNISPIEAEVTENVQDSVTKYSADATFGFAGNWQIELEAQRAENSNENAIFSLQIKPSLNDIRTEITEYDFPAEETAPLFPVYDGENIWISDAQKPRLWKFSIEDEQFTPYTFDGLTTIFMDIGKDGKIWFTDTPNSKIGSFDPKTEKFETIQLPQFNLAIKKSLPTSVGVDNENDVWVAVIDQSLLLEYNQSTKKFKIVNTITPEAGPTAIEIDDANNVWFAESLVGKLGKIDGETKELTEFTPQGEPMAEPFALMIDKEENVWIAEHIGPAITKFNPILEDFKQIKISNPDSLPFGMAFDKYDNMWVAQHVIDSLVVYDQSSGQIIEIAIPTEGSFTQFVIADDNGDIWFVEQRGGKLGKVSISAVPSQIGTVQEVKSQDIMYVELVAPIIAAGIIATALFYVKSVKDKRRIDDLISTK